MLFMEDDFVGKFVPDITKINILNCKLIVSRRCTENLFDYTNLWKRLVIKKMQLDLHSFFFFFFFDSNLLCYWGYALRYTVHSVLGFAVSPKVWFNPPQPVSSA